MADTFKTKLKTWTTAGVAVVASTTLAQSAMLHGPAAGIRAPLILVEGGEGGESGAAPDATIGKTMTGTSYALQSTDANAFKYDGKAQVEAYADLAYESYEQAADSAKELEKAVEALVDTPSQATLDAARAAWNAARPAYLRTEAFRFYDGPIEAIEGEVNAWPMNEAFIDYVDGKPDAGLINSKDAKIGIDELVAANQKTDEADVTTGFHAIEFLLWGQDASATGPGNRPFTDYVKGQGNAERRGAYLESIAEKLRGDLLALEAQWQPNTSGNYRDQFLKLDQRDALGRMVNGMAVLAGYELMSERIGVALDSGDQEDEQSCFSDTTKRDFINDLEGIRQVWTGEAGKDKRAGLAQLVATRNAATAELVNTRLADAEAKVAALGDPWDQVLAADKASPQRKQAEEVVTSLQALADAIKQAGNALGVLVLIPSE